MYFVVTTDILIAVEILIYVLGLSLYDYNIVPIELLRNELIERI